MGRIRTLVVAGGLAALGSCGLSHHFLPTPAEPVKQATEVIAERFPAEAPVAGTPGVTGVPWIGEGAAPQLVLAPAPHKQKPTHHHEQYALKPPVVEELPAPQIVEPEAGDPPRWFDCTLGFLKLICRF